MRRRDFYLTEKQNDFLEKFDELSVSEHIRRAIDGYIQQLQPSRTSSSASVLKTSMNLPGGEKNSK